jgi:outer membrane receptor protein involved in Fe transport
VRAKGADVGFRSERVAGWVTSVSVFALELDSEIVFVGDAGTTEAGRPSRRTGIEVTNFFRPLPWLSLDLDATLSRGRFTDDDPAGDRIPGAMERVIAAGVAVEGLHGFFGSVRLRYFGPRPLVEDDSVRAAASTTLSTRLGYDFQNGLRLGFEVFNLTNETNSDIDYYYESRLPGEPAEGVADVHLHPAEPRSVRLIAEWRF